MKICRTAIFILFLSILQLTYSQEKNNSNVQIEILANKAEKDKNDNVNLIFKIKNNSQETIRILKPISEFNRSIDFFSGKLISDLDSPLSMTEAISYNYKLSEKDVVEIAPKSDKEFKIEGRFTGTLATFADKFQVQLFYDSEDFINNINSETADENRLFIKNTISKLKFSSKLTKIKVK